MENNFPLFILVPPHPQTGGLNCIFKNILFIFIFRQRGREVEREGNINVWLPFVHPLLGTWPTTQTCARTGNRTGDPLVCRPALSPLSHTSQGLNCIFIEPTKIRMSPRDLLSFLSNSNIQPFCARPCAGSSVPHRNGSDAFLAREELTVTGEEESTLMKHLLRAGEPTFIHYPIYTKVLNLTTIDTWGRRSFCCEQLSCVL